MMAQEMNSPRPFQAKPSAPPQPKKLLDQVRDVIRVKHYSIRTEHTYVDWIKRYIFFTTNDTPGKWERTKFQPS